MGHTPISTPLVVGLVVATYAALLAVIGFAFRSILRGRAREQRRVTRLRRKVRRLRSEVRELAATAATGADAARRLQQLGEDLALLVAEVEALNAWRAAQEHVRRA